MDDETDDDERGWEDGLVWLNSPDGRSFLNDDPDTGIPYDDTADQLYNQGFADAAKHAQWHTRNSEASCNAGEDCPVKMMVDAINNTP